MSARVVVIGGGVAGCAAAVAAAAAGASVTQVEAARHLGGVAVTGEHRTLCGLSPIDADQPALLEPELVAAWLPFIASGAPYRQGRVWLWPTDARLLQAGLRRRLDQAGVDLRLGWKVTKVELEAGNIHAVCGSGEFAADAVIDASGRGVCAELLGLTRAPARQWPSHRSVLRLPGLGSGRAARLTALKRAQDAAQTEAAIALTPLGGAQWQLSLDVPPGVGVALAAAQASAVAAALGGELVACAWSVAHRDSGRPAARLELKELFASRERGLCWAAWPREEHGGDGVTWEWPPGDRHGIPACAVRVQDAPENLWCIGRGAPVGPEAAAALRVTGTCLALGGAVGRIAAAYASGRTRSS